MYLYPSVGKSTDAPVGKYHPAFERLFESPNNFEAQAMRVRVFTLKPVWITLLAAVAFAVYGPGAFILVWLTILEFKR